MGLVRSLVSRLNLVFAWLLVGFEKAENRRRRAHDEPSEAELLLGRSAKRLLVPELQLLQRSARQRAALQDVVLRLVVIRLGLILFDDLLEVDHVLLVRFDQQTGFRLEDWRRRECIYGDAADHEYERRSGRPPPFVEYLDMVEQVHFLSASHVFLLTVRRGGAAHGRC